MKQKSIYVGSENPAKIIAVESVFTESTVYPQDVPSLVSAQPLSDEETLEGAINRAKACAAREDGVLGIGLEGGVMEFHNQVFICNWGALVDETGELYIAAGARFPLPEVFKQPLREGQELGDLMDQYTNKQNARKKEGAVGIFTDGQVTRDQMFSHVLHILKGQYQLSKKARS
ncbi:DUF84 family protein [Radiobacillus deserti]|uniref:inosine/xanthosine triphosphatase n=1 Tax=Radiobacillus deserti TaxID=2594883 RepID=A0A516KHN7_9BACI|nr:DUF84 family protein [Radiobacillus deserti]QDP40910.1 DUF84 family protein [Radiobacillus deserti]